MKLDAFLRDGEPSWAELAALVGTAGGRAERLGPDGVRRLGRLYRSAAADLALARRRFPHDPVVGRLEEVVGRARHLVYAGHARRESVRSFLGRRYWERVVERPALLAVSALLLLAPIGIGAAWAGSDAAAAAGVVPEALGGAGDRDGQGADLGLTPAESTSFSTQIFLNNIRVALTAFAGGITGGVLTAAALVFNGLVIGVISGLAVAGGRSSVFVQLVAPHGVLELSCIVVAGAAGLRMGWSVVDPGRRRRAVALAAEARAGAELALGTAPWLVLAGVVEGFVTPAGIGVGPALAVGFGLAAVYWALAWRRGGPGRRGARRPAAPVPGPVRFTPGPGA
ncbi:MAG TPA: stage II sporulation protein M [Acidimicrobiales bacterium]|nr:stage II sporulation protein M [Acidimicrobiales bacterium]